MENRINFFQEGTDFRLRQKKLLRSWMLSCIRSENFEAGEINVIICDDDYLFRLNRQYLDHDTLTDIITFDNSENESISGDLFISIDRIRENAKKFYVRIAEELHRVIIHGILHLCGYGDKTDQEKEIMRSKENVYLFERPEKLRNSL